MQSCCCWCPARRDLASAWLRIGGSCNNESRSCAANSCRSLLARSLIIDSLTNWRRQFAPSSEAASAAAAANGVAYNPRSSHPTIHLAVNICSASARKWNGGATNPIRQATVSEPFICDRKLSSKINTHNNSDNAPPTLAARLDLPSRLSRLLESRRAARH